MAQQNEEPPNAGHQKLAQLRVEKLRKEEEDEQWISGEELYTEGSSDEDPSDQRGGGARSRRVTAEDRGPPRRSRGPAAAKSSSPRNRKKRPVAEEADGSCCSTSGNSLLPQVTVSAPNNPLLDERGDSPAAAAEDSDEEEEGVVEISWRPKRGSIKLPELSTEGGLRSLADNCCTFPNYFEKSLCTLVSTREALHRIREMDDLLFVVEAKRKESEAKTEQSQMRVRQVLKDLCQEPAIRNSKFLARNVRKFIKLSNSHPGNTLEDLEEVEPPEEKKTTTTKRPSFAVKMKGAKRSRASSKCSATTKKERNKKKKATAKFLLRNVQLAADGKGTLAETTEEKTRLTTLMRGKRPPSTNWDKFVTLDPGATSRLRDIDARLKEFAETDGSGGTCGRNNWDQTLENYVVKLEEIELSLSRLNEATTEVVSPLEEGELRRLLETCQHHQGEPTPPSSPDCYATPTPSPCPSGASVMVNAGGGGSTWRTTPTTTTTTEEEAPPPEGDQSPPPPASSGPPEEEEEDDNFGELVAEARRLMPFFKFKYNTVENCE